VTVVRRSTTTFAPFVLALSTVAFATLAGAAEPADPARQAEVAHRGADVMPFDLNATTHVFTKTGDGGVQQVLAKDPADHHQMMRVRMHLHDLQHQFLQGDFSGPSHIHGITMPGLAELKAAKPGEIAIDYRDVDGGASLTYRTGNAALVAALHAWFDAQLSDHGADAMEGHAPHVHGASAPH
jgi:hypothetical protein